MRLYLVALIVAAVPFSVSAQVVITEIMYDLREGSDSGREWIEVQNTGSTVIDLTKWKLIESGKNHTITAVQGSLAAGAYAVIADNASKFRADHPVYPGTLFDSAFSLNNDGESITLHDATGKTIDSVAYEKAVGANGTGDSLQKVESGFMPGVPTPGAGIPASGLEATPQPQKASKKNASNAPAVALAPKIVTGSEQKAHTNQVALTIASEPTSDFLWWLGAFAIATCGAFGISYSRYVRRAEWEIIEET